MELERVRKAAEGHVQKAMKRNDASHDAAHVWRVRDLALSLAAEEGLSSDPTSMEIVELAALLHNIADYKYLRDPSEKKIVENFLEEQGVEENKKSKILKIIKGMGFKDEVTGKGNSEWFPEFGVVQDADRLDTIGAIGIARCFTFGGSKKRMLHDPAIPPRSDLSKEQYMNKEEQTTINHFHEKLLKLKDMMKKKTLLLQPHLPWSYIDTKTKKDSDSFTLSNLRRLCQISRTNGALLFPQSTISKF